MSNENSNASRDWREVLNRLDEVRWELPVDYMPGMRVPGLIFADDALMETMASDQAVQQVANVATLPGIVGHSIAMPDIHWGYGFPIGGVAATRVTDGVVSPGGVGFDINCGVRLLSTGLDAEEVKPKLKTLLDQIFRDVPAGTGKGTERRFSADDMSEVLLNGAQWAVGWATARKQTSRPSSCVAPCPWPIPRRSADMPATADPTRWARSARATTSWKCRW